MFHYWTRWLRKNFAYHDYVERVTYLRRKSKVILATFHYCITSTVLYKKQYSMLKEIQLLSSNSDI